MNRKEWKSERPILLWGGLFGLMVAGCDGGLISEPLPGLSSQGLVVHQLADFDRIDSSQLALNVGCTADATVVVEGAGLSNRQEAPCVAGRASVDVELSAGIGLKELIVRQAKDELKLLLVRVDAELESPAFTQVRALFKNQCHTCHGIDSGSLFSVDGLEDEAQLLVDSLVVPGDAQASYLFQQLRGAGFAGLMPQLDVGTVSWDEKRFVQIVGDWIEGMDADAVANGGCDSQASVSPQTPLRRLTKNQLENTIRDLLSPLSNTDSAALGTSLGQAFELIPDDSLESDYARGDQSTSLAHIEALFSIGGVVGDYVDDNPHVLDAMLGTCGTPNGATTQLLDETFSGASALQNWNSTFEADSSGAASDASLFVIENGSLVTEDPEINIYSHYVGAGSDTWSNYRYEGSMQRSSGGIGVTFFSNYPQTDRYLRLRAYDNEPFEIAPHPASSLLSPAQCKSNVPMVENESYRFVVQLDEDRLQAKVWKASEQEPAAWSIDNCIIDLTQVPSLGTVGVWSMRAGRKSWDDLRVTPISASGCSERQKVERLLQKIFRRPPQQAEVDTFDAFRIQNGWGASINRLLMSPEFIYHLELDGEEVTTARPGWTTLSLTDFEIANRLSYQYWNTMPDETLFAWAEQGVLRTDAGFATALEYVVTHNNLKNTTSTFVAEWLKLNELPSFSGEASPSLLAAAPEIVAGGLQSFRDAAIKEAIDFVHHIIETNSSVDDLFFKGGSTTLEPRLAAIYGTTPTPADPGTATEGLWRDSSSDARGGLLGRVALHLTGGVEASPIHVGARVQKRILCRTIDAPPASVQDQVSVPAPNPMQSHRDRIEEATAPASCSVCHAKINPVGFALQNLDAFGRWVDEEITYLEDGSVLATHVLDTRVDSANVFPGDQTPVDGVQEMSQRIVDSGVGQACFGEQYYRFSFGDEGTAGCGPRFMADSLDESAGLLDVIKAPARLDRFRFRHFTEEGEVP